MSEIDDDERSAFFANSGKDGGIYDYTARPTDGFGHFGGTIRPAIWQHLPVPERQWTVNDWIPKHCVTGLYGDGGVGKSLLAMMLMTCVSQGYNFLGLPTHQDKVFGYFCEDTEDELHRRQNDINLIYGCEFYELENMAIQSRVGCDNILMNFQHGIGTPSDSYKIMREEIRDIGAKFVTIDTAADTYGGNENARPEVRQYINLLGQLALEINGTVVLCAHPSRSGLADETGSGGSTAWNNTLRSRLYLRKPKIKDGDDELSNTAIRELQKMKSNYSSIGDKITLKWYNGGFHLTDDVSNQSQSDRKLGDVQQLIVKALELFMEFPIDVNNLLLAVLPSIPHDPSKKDERRKRFFNAITRLASQGHFVFRDGLIYKN